MFESFIESIAKAVLPGIFCGIIKDAAGPGCKNLKVAILMNDDLLQAWKDADDGQGWCYSRVVSITKQYPNVSEMINTDIVIQWLEEQEMFDIVNMIENTSGGRYWLDRQVNNFKKDLF